MEPAPESTAEVPGVAATERASRPPGAGGGHSRLPLTLAAVGGIAVVVVVAFLLASGGGGGSESSTTASSRASGSGSQPRVLDGGIQAKELPVGVAAEGNDVYIADRTGNEVIHGDAGSMQAAGSVSTDKHPEDVVVVGGSVFVTVPDAHSLLVFDRDLNPTGSVDLGPGSKPAGITTGDGEVWVAGEGSGAVYEIDPSDPAAFKTLDVGAREAFGIGVTTDALWVADRAANAVIRYDRKSGATESFAVGPNPKGVAVAGGRVYVANPDNGTISILSESDPSSDPQTVNVGGQPRAIDVLDGRVWVSNGDTEGKVDAGDEDGWVSVFDASTGELVEPKLRVGGSPEGLGVSSDRVWVATGPEKQARAIAP